MALIRFEFTPEENVRIIPMPICSRYQLISLTIEATSLIGLVEAIRKMRIFFRFDYGATRYHAESQVYHLSQYLWVTDQLINVIDFENEILKTKAGCTAGSVAIADAVFPPVTRMILVLEDFT
ncbi:MAG: hypothetical protein JWO44_2645 [Bacteroidetes bacterium]|nr:hypothetical protein [Bacteroidota bacterium]